MPTIMSQKANLPDLAHCVLALTAPMISAGAEIRSERALDDLLGFAMFAWNVEVLLMREPLLAGRMLLDVEDTVKKKTQERLYRDMFEAMRQTKRSSFPDDVRMVARMSRTQTRAGDDGVTYSVTVQEGIPLEYISQ